MPIIIVAVVAALASILGIIFLGKATDSLQNLLQNKTFWIVGILILAVVFRDIIKAVLMAVIGILK